MRWISKRTWILGLLALASICFSEYLLWREGCGWHWLPAVHAQDNGGDQTQFYIVPCRAYREMPLLDKLVALAMVGFIPAFVISFVMDIVGALKRRKRAEIS